MTDYKEKAEIRILVVDDDEIFHATIGRMLETLGYTNFSKATDGKQAWGLISDWAKMDQPFDLVLTDWSMPTLDGMQLIEKISHHEATRSLKMILVTGYKDRDHVVAAGKTQIVGYLAKPIAIEALRKKLESVRIPQTKAA